MIVEILVPMTVFATIFGVLYIFFTTRNKERMAMIEKGADPSIFSSRPARLGIKVGLLAMGVALGVLFGQLIAHTSSMDIEPATVSMIFFCAGLGLVIDHFLAKKEA
jgi:Domain of unknown function (DUF6249)